MVGSQAGIYLGQAGSLLLLYGGVLGQEAGQLRKDFGRRAFGSRIVACQRLDPLLTAGGGSGKLLTQQREGLFLVGHPTGGMGKKLRQGRRLYRFVAGKPLTHLGLCRGDALLQVGQMAVELLYGTVQILGTALRFGIGLALPGQKLIEPAAFAIVPGFDLGQGAAP